MNRRRWLETVSAILTAACSAVVAIPGVRYLLATVKRQQPQGSRAQCVARLNDLPTGIPMPATVTGARRDAWILFPDEIIGRIWLVRRGDDTIPPKDAQVDAFSSVCPHLRCAIQLDSSRQSFQCPCHNAGFNFEGNRLSESELGRPNPAPRGMDRLLSRVVQQDEEWWVEVTYTDFVNGVSEQIPIL